MNDPHETQLVGAVMIRISQRRQVRARTSAAGHAVILVAAGTSLVPAVQYLWASAAQTGFSQYISLLVSDGGTVAVAWKDFALTIAESAPIAATALTLGILLVFAYSTRQVAGDLSRLHAKTA